MKIVFKLVKKIFHIYCSVISIERNVKYLGTSYGGWHFSDENLSKNLTVVSAGVGEDISFDIELFNKFKVKLFLIDPTPRAVLYVQKIIANLGNSKTLEFDESSGNQPIEAYDLSDIQEEDFILIEKALYNKSESTIKFFAPPKKEFVSYSISNFQHNFSKDTDYIKVKTITLSDIMIQNKINKIDILKLDIEGAENQVIPNMLRNKIYPKQILVEFDELTTSFIKPYIKAIFIISHLKLKNYKLVKTNQFPNFLFIRG